MRKLKIHGPGNLLGAQQHGHIAAVGYDLYAKLLAEPVRELGGEPAAASVEPVISVAEEGFVPEDYVPEVNQRLAFYKRLAGATDDAAVEDIRAELIDRFGPLPEPARRLPAFVRLAVAAPPPPCRRSEPGVRAALS